MSGQFADLEISMDDAAAGFAEAGREMTKVMVEMALLQIGAAFGLPGLAAAAAGVLAIEAISRWDEIAAIIEDFNTKYGGEEGTGWDPFSYMNPSNGLEFSDPFGNNPWRDEEEGDQVPTSYGGGGPVTVTIYADINIEIGAVSGEVDLGMVTNAVNEGIGDAIIRTLGPGAVVNV